MTAVCRLSLKLAVVRLSLSFFYIDKRNLKKCLILSLRLSFQNNSFENIDHFPQPISLKSESDETLLQLTTWLQLKFN